MKSPLAIITGFFLLIALAGSFFFRNNVSFFLKESKAKILSSFNEDSNVPEIEALKRENIKLKYEIDSLKGNLNTESKYSYKEAQIYSYYPFSNRSLLILNLGSDDGIKEGAPILINEGILFGKIKNVKRTQSEAITIFDPSWRSSVAIGDSGTKAVLRGGEKPKLELIPPDSQIFAGDKVLNISPEFPLDLFVGSLTETQKSKEDVWLKADLETLADFDSLKKVFVIMNFP